VSLGSFSATGTCWSEGFRATNGRLALEGDELLWRTGGTDLSWPWRPRLSDFRIRVTDISSCKAEWLLFGRAVRLETAGDAYVFLLHEGRIPFASRETANKLISIVRERAVNDLASQQHVRIVRPHERDANTAQTPGMTRVAGIAASTVDSSEIWMGEVTTTPGFRSGAHHHGDVESAIYVLSGSYRFRWGDRLQHSAEGSAGDFIFVPANVVHQEMNTSDSEPFVFILARGSQENVVVNVDSPESALM
jgi:uncharacterized RmlC-like cupin family protein